MNEICKAALAYARRGLPVFPCGPSKRPLTERGFYDATTDEVRIRAWFDKAEPPLIAMPTGTRSAIDVLDCDMRPGVDGIDALQTLAEQHGGLPDAPVVLTPSGGQHLWFKRTAPVRNSAGKLGLGIDVRGDGGYVIVPPSQANGARYEWEAESPDTCPPLPAWLLAKLAPPVPRSRPQARPPNEGEKARALSALQRITYSGESRDEWLEIGMAYKAAGGSFEAFDAWSAEQPGYDATKIWREWESWATEGGITPGTLYYHAKRHGWTSGAAEALPNGDTFDIADLGLEEHRTAKGEFAGYLPTLSNVAKVLEGHPRFAGRLAWNEARSSAEFTESGAARDLTDAQANEIRAWMDTGLQWRGKPNRLIVFDALDMVARRHAYHPVRNYLSGLQWDSVERLPFWLDDYCGVPRSQYSMAVAAKTLIGAVARVFSPGCKLDTMLVLVGPQGALKSTLCATLARGWHADTPIPIGNKDAYQALRGVWCYEFAELASMHGKESERLKAFFSSAADTYRPSFGRYVVTEPRSCWFVATTNDQDFLHDATGARRYWCVPVSSIDIEALARNVDQLWAEAVVQYHEGEPWHLEGEAAIEARTAAEHHYAEDPWEAPIRSCVEGREKVRALEILGHLGIPMERRTKADQMRVTRIMCDRIGYRKGAIRDHLGVGKGYTKNRNQ